jgi:hypothetical protein
LKTHILHYDWYSPDFEATVKGLLKFLEFQVHKNGEFPTFVKGKKYQYFTVDEKRAIAKAFEIMASPDTWSQTKRYFDEGEMVENNDAGWSTERNVTEITCDVQFLLDFALVGYTK